MIRLQLFRHAFGVISLHIIEREPTKWDYERVAATAAILQPGLRPSKIVFGDNEAVVTFPGMPSVKVLLA